MVVNGVGFRCLRVAVVLGGWVRANMVCLDFLEVQEAKKEMREVKALSTIAWSILFGQGPLYI